MIHYTYGGPWFKQTQDHPHADVWYAACEKMHAVQHKVA
jgi:hypothetical protein